MIIKIGCDLVHLPRFMQAMQKPDFLLLKRIFTDRELIQSPSIERLAGFFAVKESVIKALQLEVGCWHCMEIGLIHDGKPYLETVPSRSLLIKSHDISISHDGEYVTAVSVFLIDVAD